jgi:hypothetical protein
MTTAAIATCLLPALFRHTDMKATVNALKQERAFLALLLITDPASAGAGGGGHPWGAEDLTLSPLSDEFHDAQGPLFL